MSLPFPVTRRFVVCVLFAACVFSLAILSESQTSGDQTAYQQALQLLQSGNPTGALEVIENALAAGSHDPALYNLKGLAAGELGRNQEAEESFRTVIRLAPKSAMGYDNLGVLLSSQGRHREAVSAFREAHTVDPKDFTALLGLGTSLVALHEYGQAVNYLQKAQQLHPEDFQTGYEYALALREAKQASAAKKVLSEVPAPQEPRLAVKYYALAGVVYEDLKEFAAASQAYSKAYAIDSNSYELYLSLVRTALASNPPHSAQDFPAPPGNLSAPQNLALALLFSSYGAFDQAIPQFQECLRKDNASEPAALGLAMAYKNAGNSAKAADILREYVKAYPSAAIDNTLASAEEESGQFVEAVKDYQRAVDLDPTNEQYYFDLGMDYLSHFTFGPAAEVFQVGTQKFPKSSRQFLGLAYSRYAVREYPTAADAFTTALELDPRSPGVFQAWKVVLSFLAPKDWDSLLPRLRRLQSDNPKNAELAFCYGAALFRSELAKGQDQLGQPQLLLEKAVRLKANFPEAHLELGNLYAAQKQDQKAVNEYLEAIRQDPKSDIAHYRLGQVYRGMNKFDLATQELARYQELSQAREEELKRSRSAIKQFVLSQPAKSD